MQAYALVDAPNAPRQADREALRTYPLYPYLQAARIRRGLASASGQLGSVDQRAQTFTTYYANEPVGRELRRVWLTSLAEREQWQAFIEHYRPEIADDALRCQSLSARIALDRTADLPQDIARLWLTPSSLPDCERPFEWLRGQNALTVSLIEQRARLALKENNPGFARQIAAQLPPERAAPLLQWAALLESPQRQVDALIGAPASPVEDEALLAGWTRLARQNRDTAMLRYQALVDARGLTAQSASRYALALALALAWDHRPEALEYFTRVEAPDLDDYALEWQARAALWAEDWKLVVNVIAAMSETQRGQARWRYWAARAAERTEDARLARQLYESVLIDDNFYSLMAAARLDRPLAPHPQKLPVDPAEIQQIEQLPALVRVRELLLCEMRAAAGAEWAYGFDILSQAARAQAVHLAVQWGWYDQAIAVAAQLRIFNDYALLYPQPFSAEVRAGAKLSGVPRDLIYGVMRQESLYRADAISTAGARGLLQLLPETARRTARTWKRPKPTAEDLLNPGVNVPLGAAQLRTLIDRFDGQTILALAGYNAGPNAVRRWLPAQSLEPDIWIENIPYNETRGYVQRILWHQLVFAWLRSGEPQQATPWLARVAPLEEGTVLGSR